MTEDWMLPSDWVKKEFPNYSFSEVEKACEELRADFISDSEFLHDYAFYSGEISGNAVDLMDEEEATEFVEDNLIQIAMVVDRPFIEKYLEYHFTPVNESLTESYLTEADDIDIDDIDVDTDTEVSDTELEDEPAEEETEVTVDDIDNDEDTNINEMQKKTIQFPILIEGFDEENNAISMNEEDEEQYASEYGEAVVQQVEENKKFILSALDIYDLELFYESLDPNSNVKFTVTSSKELDSSILMNILKRYFNVEMEAKALDYGEFTLNPVLDNKFIRISGLRVQAFALDKCLCFYCIYRYRIILKRY